MNRFTWLAFWRSPDRALKTLFLMLVPLSILCVKSVADSATRPRTAVVAALQGVVSMRPAATSETTPSTRVHRGQAIPIRRENEHLLLVPESYGRTEHWVHFSFQGGTPPTPIVQAGTDSTDSEYLFPCQYRRGTVVIGWGTRRVGNHCKQITIASSRGRSKQLPGKWLAQSGTQGDAQNDSEALTLEASNRLNVVYINQSAGRPVINVLTGGVRVKSATQTTIVGAGVQYIDSGDGRRGATRPIPPEVYAARPVQIFLDPNNWTEEVRPQIKDFQAAIDLQKNRPVNSDTTVPRIEDPT
ncbi:MAG: hypothetical protein HC780_21985, partial [Leptolyngbyaceae cyanobacterium CSU_1_3]|nr:hypothetical protein [Leptolyngbyaceae cyanobacterium CSU_1_3]